MAKLIVLVGESASGKTTRSKDLIHDAIANGRKIVRFNRDEMRAMIEPPKGDNLWESYAFKGYKEGFISQMERNAVQEALQSKIDIIVDETNLSEKTMNCWRAMSESLGAELEVLRMETPFDVCLLRDSRRTHGVGRAVIERQFLTSGRADFGNKPIVIVDIDGTLANHEQIRSPHNESMVLWDREYPVVCEWVRNLSQFYSIVVVSGRHCSCGKDTVKWLEQHNIVFDHLLMRNSGDNRPDNLVKQDILSGILRCGVLKSQIQFVIDDRPKVIRMWKENGLTVYPVRGQVEEF